MNFAQAAAASMAGGHAAVHGPEPHSANPPDPRVFLTDESGNRLTDPGGNRIVEG